MGEFDEQRAREYQEMLKRMHQGSPSPSPSPSPWFNIFSGDPAGQKPSGADIVVDPLKAKQIRSGF